jgi:hypothetical protein
LLTLFTNLSAQTVKSSSYDLYIIEFGKDTLFVRQVIRYDGRVFQPCIGGSYENTLITVMASDNRPIYQTSLPFIPKRGDAYPFTLPKDDVKEILAESFDKNFNSKIIGHIVLKR